VDANPRCYFGGFSRANGSNHLSLVRAVTPTGHIALNYFEAQASSAKGIAFARVLSGISWAMTEPDITPEMQHARFIASLWPIGASVTVLWIAAQPLAKIADPSDMFLAGMAASGAIFGASATGLAKGRWVIIWSVGTIIAAVLALYFGVGSAHQAMKDEIFNHARCKRLQDDMLSPAPKRSDAPAIFQALSCRPQGEGMVYPLGYTGPH
jgi:hypothetical protein